MTSTISPSYSKLPLSLHRTLPLTQQMSQEKDKCCKCETKKVNIKRSQLECASDYYCYMCDKCAENDATFEKGNREHNLMKSTCELHTHICIRIDSNIQLVHTTSQVDN